MMKLVLAFVSLMLYAGVTTETMDGTIYYDGLPITAEPGTSVEFGCVFDHEPEVKPLNVILRKCKPGISCLSDKNNTVFSSTDANATMAEFRGRTSLMVPDLSQKNCSIRIDDVEISMTGRYVIGIRGIREHSGVPDIINRNIEKPITVTGLRQPKITGQTILEEEASDLNLTCNGESKPPAVVSWSFNDTILLSANQTATLTIKTVTPENAGKYICIAEHLNVSKTTPVDVVVICTNNSEGIYYDEERITAEPGTSAEISCTFKHCAGFKPTAVILRKCEPGSFCDNNSNVIFNSSDVNATTGLFKGRVVLMEPDLGNNCSVLIREILIDMTGNYQIGLEGQRNGRPASINTVREKPIKVTGLRQPKITGATILEEGSDLNLTCDGESKPPAVVSWSFNDIILLSSNQTSTLTIPMVTPENAGNYICAAEHLNVTKTTSVHVFVISHPVKEEFMPGMLALSIVVFLFVVVTLAACFFRCRKSSSDQDENMEMIIPQEQQGGVHGHEQNIQEGDAPHSEDENV